MYVYVDRDGSPDLFGTCVKTRGGDEETQGPATLSGHVNVGIEVL
jgi:hypothetical protein